jgi:hypothetical protein
MGGSGGAAGSSTGAGGSAAGGAGGRDAFFKTLWNGDTWKTFQVAWLYHDTDSTPAFDKTVQNATPGSIKIQFHSSANAEGGLFIANPVEPRNVSGHATVTCFVKTEGTVPTTGKFTLRLRSPHVVEKAGCAAPVDLLQSVPMLRDGGWHTVKLPLTADPDSVLGGEWNPNKVVELFYQFLDAPASFTAWLDDCTIDD